MRRSRSAATAVRVRCRASRVPAKPPARQGLWSRSSGVCGNQLSPCGVKPCIGGRAGGAEVENLLIVFVQDIFTAGEHLPVLVELVLGIEIDAGIGIDP